MKVLLDENLPVRLRLLIDEPHEAFTVKFLGWDGTKNGKLLRLLAENGFDALITNDKNLEYQQNLTGIQIAILVIDSTSNEFPVLKRFFPKVNQVLNRPFKPGIHKILE